MRLECTKEMLAWFKINIDNIKYDVCFDKLCLLIAHDPVSYLYIEQIAVQSCIKFIF